MSPFTSLGLGSLFRTGRGCVGWVHHPHKCSVGDEITALPTQLRGNHYWLRSFQDVREKSILWGKVRLRPTPLAPWSAACCT